MGGSKPGKCRSNFKKHLDQNGAKINIHVAALLMLRVCFRKINMKHWYELLNFYFSKAGGMLAIFM
jgi:hypothetical protein